MRTHFFLAMLVATYATQSSDAPLEKDFELRPGQTITITGTGSRVTFEAVVEDSRCPAGVQCIWAGNARVTLRVGPAGQDTTVSLNTGLEPHAVVLGKLRLELKAVTPGPQPGATIPPDTYRVTLRATAA